MNKNTFPPLEPENSLPEAFPEIPQQMEPLEDLPRIEELTFAQEATEAIEDPATPEEDFETPVIDEITFQEEIPQEEADPIPEENPVILEKEVLAEEISENNAELPIKQPEVLPEEQAPEISDLPEPDMEFAETEETVFDLPIPPEEPPAEPQEEPLDQEGQDFEAMMNPPTAPQPEKAPPVSPTIIPKGRPKRKKGEGLLGIPSILVTFVWLALIVIIGVTAGRMLWICAADVLAFGREDKVVTVTVYEADTMEDIINKLHEGGLIRYKSLFSLYADISDAEEDIKPGIYDLNTRYDYHALVNFMSPRSSREVIKLTIPEGYTCRQIFALLEENRICTAVDAAAYAANGELSEYWFLEIWKEEKKTAWKVTSSPIPTNSIRILPPEKPLRECWITSNTVLMKICLPSWKTSTRRSPTAVTVSVKLSSSPL